MQQESQPISALVQIQIDEIMRDQPLDMDAQDILNHAIERVARQESERRLPLDRSALAKLNIIKVLTDDLAEQPEGSPIVGTVSELLKKTVDAAIGSTEDSINLSERILRKGKAA